MDKRNRLWRRLVGIPRRRRHGRAYSAEAISQQADRPSNHGRRPYMYSHPTFSDLVNQGSNDRVGAGWLAGRVNHVRDRWLHDGYQNDSSDQGHSNTRRGFWRGASAVTPKILSGVNTQNILQGQESYDSFSSNCWLEDHLHMFGNLTQADSNLQVANENQNPQPELLADCVPICDSNSNNGTVSNRTVSSRATSTLSSSDRSTVSDVTRFYNSQNLCGPAYDPHEPPMLEPPPYSELPVDPPPPYSESDCGITTQQLQQQQEASGHHHDPLYTNSGISFFDILW